MSRSIVYLMFHHGLPTVTDDEKAAHSVLFEKLALPTASRDLQRKKRVDDDNARRHGATSAPDLEVTERLLRIILDAP